MESGYIGLDLAQIIFAIAVTIVLIGFAIWGFRTRHRLRKIEAFLRDFRELEPEGFEEEEAVDTISEASRMESDETAAHEDAARRILERT